MHSRNMRPEIERTKKALKQLATARRARLWGQLVAQGYCKASAENRDLFEIIFRNAYWTGASDVMTYEIPSEATPEATLPREETPSLPA